MSNISKEFQETIFEGKHLHKQTFDESMDKTTNSFLQQPEKIGEHDMENFQDVFSEELNDALKQWPSTSSSDTDEFHIQLMKKLGIYSRTFFSGNLQ